MTITAETVLAQAVLAQTVLAQTVLAQSVLAQSVLAQSVLAQSVLAQSVLAQSVWRERFWRRQITAKASKPKTVSRWRLWFPSAKLGPRQAFMQDPYPPLGTVCVPGPFAHLELSFHDQFEF